MVVSYVDGPIDWGHERVGKIEEQYQDVVKECIRCRSPFYVSAGEQSFLVKHGKQQVPGFCKTCRAEHKRKQSSR